jgi:AGZA family xanthine/uracil permease-like MFS transporter
MARNLVEIDREHVTEYAPAAMTAIAMPLTVSIANGIAFGFILYVAIKRLAGRTTEASPAVIAFRLLFFIGFVKLSPFAPAR